MLNKMSIKETNKPFSRTNISKSLNTRRVTQQQTAQIKASVSHDIYQVQRMSQLR